MMNKSHGNVPSRKSGNRAEIVTVSGGKGGVGKTFFAVNFAVELSKRGYRVLIFDADINLSNVYLLLNIDNNNNFRDFLDAKIEINDIIQKGIGGVDVLYAGGEFNGIFKLKNDELNTILQGLSEVEQQYDYLVIDTQAGLHELNFKLMYYSDRNILVTNPEITALVDLYRLIKIANQNKPGIRYDIVINRAFSAGNSALLFQKVSRTVSEFRIKTQLSFLGYIVEDSKRVIESIQKRIPIVMLHERGNIAGCFRMIVDLYLKGAKPKRKLPFFLGLLQR